MKNNNLAGGLFAAGKPAPLTIKETPLSAQIKEYLDGRNIYNDRLQCGQFQTPSGHWMRGSKTGTPDRFAILSGQIFFIEVKKYGEKPTPEQLEKHAELRQSGAVVIIADEFYKFVAHFNAVRVLLETRGRQVNLYD